VGQVCDLGETVQAAVCGELGTARDELIAHANTVDATGPVRLRIIKTLHTVVWAFFVACISAIPVFALERRFAIAGILIATVGVEVLVLAVSSWRCPLTPLAAHFTEDRRANFDIYLPEWLARHNKLIFGALYVGGIALTFAFARYRSGW
jgi:hypothetical protein